eukprot:CAMPEP_0170469264 /NCGR_PEP_ID=MMETSP0123-20130129/12152_1 /TAXON_ID=182087 /ORGANISM="Favella ehrenbergii, Strain Fehren 1" /LENGTH=220 /DNA_ID=CAMNT_0010736075 /DNA_START=152 /DNA_END=813 /DNA_ORIENTATION=+
MATSDRDDAPEVAVVGGGEQIVHLARRIVHILLCAVNVFAEPLDLHILRLDRHVEVLCFILGGLDDSNYLFQVAILILQLLLLQTEDLPVVQVARLIELAIFASIEARFFLVRCEGSLAVLNSAILLSQLPTNHFLKLLDEVDTASDLLLAQAREPVCLVLILEHELVEVHHVGLQGGKRGLHEVLLAGDGLALPRVIDLVDLVLELLAAILRISVVPLE